MAIMGRPPPDSPLFNWFSLQIYRTMT